VIRKIETKEIPECVKIIRESFATVAAEFGLTRENAPRFTAFAVTEERLIWQMEKEHRPMFGYEEDGAIVGYYSLSLKEGHVCELNNLCVLPGCRHRGIGEELLKDASETARKLNCGKMEIGIVEENRVLKDWYASFGFVHTGTQKFDFFPFACGYMEKKL